MLNDEELEQLFNKLIEDNYDKTFKIAVIENDKLTIVKISAGKMKNTNEHKLCLVTDSYIRNNKGQYFFNSPRWKGALESGGRWTRVVTDTHFGLFDISTKEHQSSLDLILKKLDHMLNNEDVIITYDEWNNG